MIPFFQGKFDLADISFLGDINSTIIFQISTPDTQQISNNGMIVYETVKFVKIIIRNCFVG